MANELNIGVRFGSEGIPEVTKSITQLQAQFKRFQTGLNNATGVDSIARLNRAIDQTKTRMQALQKFTGATGGVLSGPLTQGANQAGFALTNLGRIAQDAPFGFIGIQNNINPLLESFQRLKAETGTTGGALKALGSSLLGAGGLGLAVSLVTSTLTLFSMGMLGAKKELEGFAKAQADANKGAGEEIANLKVLASAAANTTNSTKDRQTAAEQLTKALKENNVQLTQEEALNNKAATAIDIATKAILERAKARAIENRIAELSSQNLDRELKRVEIADQLATAQKTLSKETENAAKNGRLLVSSISGRQAQITVESLTDKIKSLDTETAKASGEIDNLLAKVTAAPQTGGSDPIVDLLKQRIDALKQLRTEAGLTTDQQIQLAGLEIQLAKRDSIKAGFSREELQERINAIIENAFPTGTFEFDISPSININPEKITAQIANKGQKIDISKVLGLDKITDADIEKSTEPVVKALQKSAEKIRETIGQASLNALNEQIAGMMSSIQTEGIGKLSEALGNTLAGVGGAGDLFKSLFTVIADGAQQLGKALIAYGIALTGFKLALKSLNPIAAIAAGAGLIIAGSALKAAIPKFAGGVQNFSGGFAIVGERGPELVNLPRGSDVIPNHMLNQSQTPIILQPSLTVQGKDLIVMLQRVSNSNTRTGGPTIS